MRLKQEAFGAGEVSVEISGRDALAKYHVALRKALNMFIHPQGGASNRSGMEYVGDVHDHAVRPRSQEFVAATNDAYVLEFGHNVMRIIRDGAYVVWPEDDGNAGDIVEINTPWASTELDGLYFEQSNDIITVTSHGFPQSEIRRTDHHLWEIVNVSFTPTATPPTGLEVEETTGFTPTGEGTAAKVHRYAVAAVGLDGVESLVCPSVEVENWLGYAANYNTLNWDGVGAAPQSMGVPTWYADGYGNWTGNTVINRTFRLTNGATLTKIGAHRSIESIAVGYKAEVWKKTATADFMRVASETFDHPGGGWYDHELVAPYEIPDDGAEYYVAIVPPSWQGNTSATPRACAYKSSPNPAGDTFYMSSAYIPAMRVEYDPEAGDASGVDHFVVYKERNGYYGLLGRTPNSFFVDDNIAPDFTQGPQQGRNPFIEAGNPAISGFHDQRRLFAQTPTRPQTFFGTQSSNYNNMGQSIPLRDDDAFEYTVAARDRQTILHMLSHDALLIFTPTAEWKVTGSNDNVITPTGIKAKPQSNYGCSARVKPVVVGGQLLFVNNDENIVYDMAYKFETDKYASEDRTILAPHIFKGRKIAGWSYAKVPHSLIHVYFDDGGLATFTYLKDHDVWAWSPQMTCGYIESISTVPENGESVSYFFVRRWRQGQWKRSVERMRSRTFRDIEDAFFVDCGLSIDTKVVVDAFTFASPAVFTLVDHEFEEDQTVHVRTTRGLDGRYLNGRYRITNVADDTFRLEDLAGQPVNMADWKRSDLSIEVRKLVTELSGLEHLASMEVAVLADGNVVEGQTVSAEGELTLTEGAGRVHIGMSYFSDLETLELPVGKETADGIMKAINDVSMKLNRSRGFKVGPSFEKLVEPHSRDTSQGMFEPAKEFTGNLRLDTISEWNDHGRVCVRQSYPLPLSILTISPDIEYAA